jgi:uncharacterized membrane protein YoaK (UPF0700 family)
VTAAAALAGVLALVAGFSDGVAYLRWHEFAANQTGNTVLLGLAAYRHDWPTALRVFGSIVSLLLGAGVAAALRTRFPPLVPLLLEAALLAGASFAERHSFQLDLVAFAMGVQNQALTTFAGLRLNTSFITGNYAQLGSTFADLVFGQPGTQRGRRIAILVTLVFAYAVGGASAAFSNERLPHGLLVIAVIVVALACVVHRARVGVQPASQA